MNEEANNKTNETYPNNEAQDQANDTTSSTPNLLNAADRLTLDLNGELAEKPDSLNEKFWDTDNNKLNPQAIYDELQLTEKRVHDLRSKMGKGEHKAPEKADGYKLELSEELQQVIPNDDPLLQSAKEVAHKHGMSQEMFAGFMQEMAGKIAEISQDAPSTELTEQQQQEYIDAELGKLGENGVRIARANNAFLNQMKSEGVLSDTGLQGLQNSMQTAEAIQGLNELRVRIGGDSVPFDTIDDGLPADSIIADRLAKAYDAADQNAVREVEALLEQRIAAGRPERLQF